eukprot:m.5700 g.5700  ORF g.5700 m.5700 type:complete len:136 (-) comp2441_c0_seq2:34-441(-)
MCEQPVVPLKPGFNNCMYRIAGIKAGENMVVGEPWTRCDDEYTTYDEHQAGIVSWSMLKIYVRPLPASSSATRPAPTKCVVCFGEFGYGDVLSCGHGYHTHHLAAVVARNEKAGRPPCCVLCDGPVSTSTASSCS